MAKKKATKKKAPAAKKAPTKSEVFGTIAEKFRTCRGCTFIAR